MQKFNSSIEATDFIDQLQAMLNDPRLAQWVRASDYNFGVAAESALQQAQVQLDEMVAQLEQAC